MITFTKEQLIASAHARIEFAEMMLAGELEPLKERTWSIELELARIALASLEAKSRKLFTCSGCGAEGLDEPLESKCHCNEDGALWVEGIVYTAPPAPVPVPAAMEMDDDFDSAFEHGKAVGWNACRSVMLQGAEPVTTAYKLPPHIFRELVNRLRDTAVKYQGCQQLREQLSRTLQEVIQPAEPQQEVTQALAKGMERYGDAMQKLADSGD